jgi:hypothetical protein
MCACACAMHAWYYICRCGGGSGGGSPFDRIGGNGDAKARLRALVLLPHSRPELFAGSRLLRGTSGVLLHGPPGTGKVRGWMGMDLW